MLDSFDQQHRDAVNEDHSGKRRNELSWRIHRIHWEKNRFVFDLMYQKRAMSKQLVRPLHAPPASPPSFPASC